MCRQLDASAPGSDAAPDGPPTCGATEQLCSGVCIPRDDPDHCGSCSNHCAGTDPTIHTLAACRSGSCGYTCERFWGDCDGVTTNGCETPLDGVDPANCGACGARCTHPGLACLSGVCVHP